MAKKFVVVPYLILFESNTCIPWPAELSEPCSTAPADVWGDGDGLDVGDSRWAPEHANVSREWGLQPA